jgi:hypothetical protein
MARIELKAIRSFDNGVNTPESFFVFPTHHNIQDSARLVGDLLLATRAEQASDVPVDFDVVEQLVNEAAPFAASRVDQIMAEAGVLATQQGLHWAAWNQDVPNMRHPTPEEVIDFEGESRILLDALPADPERAPKSARMLAAWGCYCIERGLIAIAQKEVQAAMNYVASAGLLLAHSSYYTGCVIVHEEGRLESMRKSSRGGTNAAAHWRAVEAEAVRLAKEGNFDTGEFSAEYVAAQIVQPVREFARLGGRDFSGDSPVRKIAEYLRKAGIKKRR